MGTLFPINLWTAAALVVAALVILEILFLFARIIENEISLHNLKVRSHTLRLRLLTDSADQMVLEWEYEHEQTGKPMAEIMALNGAFPNQSAEPPPDENLTTATTKATEQPAPDELNHAAPQAA